MSDITDFNMDTYEVYEATVPHDYHDSWMCSLLADHRNFPNIVWKAAYMYLDKPIFRDTVTITAVNGKYKLHPGIARFLVGAAIGQPIKALIVNRYGTDYDTIKQTFPDARLSTVDIPSFVSYCVNRKVHFHNFFQDAVKDNYALTALESKYELFKQAKHTLIVNNECQLGYNPNTQPKHIEVKTLHELVRKTLPNFTDFEG